MHELKKKAGSEYAEQDGFDFAVIEPELLQTLSGLELMQMMVAGKLPPPPIAKVTNIVLSEVGEGRAVFRGAPKKEHLNPAGSIHGGWVATILDSALGCAVHASLPAGVGYGTIDLGVKLVRPLSASSGEVICEANTVHLGRTIATSEAKLTRADGKLVAHGSCTCSLFKHNTGTP